MSEKTRENYSWLLYLSDFTPFVLLLVVPSLTLMFLLTLKLGELQFQTSIFFVFLITILGFLYAMKWLLYEEPNPDEALGLPPRSISTVIALSVIFFALFVTIFKLTVLPEIVTLLTALVSFYFGATTASKKKEGKNAGDQKKEQKTDQ